MAFTVPFSSSPPSTPDSRSQRSKGLGQNARSFASNLSTTPAGPPPSSTPARPTPSFTPSFTPAGLPPPSSLFGSSKPPSSRGKILFNSKPPPPSSSPEPSLPEDDEMEEEEPDGEEGPWESEDASETGSMEVDEEWQQQPVNAISTSSSKFRESASSAGAFDWAKYGSSTMSETPRGMGMQRSRDGNSVRYLGDSKPYNSPTKPRVPKNESPIPKIAKNMAMQLGTAKLTEPDHLIMKNERILNELNQAGPDQQANPEALFAPASQELSKVWRESQDQDQQMNGLESGLSSNLGPDSAAPGYHKARYLGSLLLQLHHPPPARGLQALAVSKFGRSSLRGSQGPVPSSYRPTAQSKVLLDWMEDNYNPYVGSAAAVQSHLPNPTAHPLYWDIIFASILRGKLPDVMSIFKRSNFENARTAREEGQNQDGYSAMTVKNIKRVIDRAVQALSVCPALQDEDWDVAGNEWAIFRKRISSAIDDLTTFAEGRYRDRDSSGSDFEASNFGVRSTSSTLSQSARRAESQVPWTIYKNLKTMYGIILGGVDEIISVAQDWVEVTVGLAVWWDGNEEDLASRRSMSQSQSRGSRLIDLNTTEAYLRRLADAFEEFRSNDKYGLAPVDTNNPVEVGLASVFEGNIEGVVALLRGWSLPVASAVVEIGYLGSWYNPTRSPEQMDAFDESDLLVLSSYGNGDKAVTRDELLVEYAEALAHKDQITDRFSLSVEGWELSIQILSRLNDSARANRKRSELLQNLRLDSDRTMDKVLKICQIFELNEDACRLAERYADHISESTTDYGDALIYYSRAHRPQKVKTVLDLLVSLCIVQSTAFPPFDSMDKNLHALVETPQDSLTRLEAFDADAASTLHQYLTGYATVRRFYELRDGEVNAKEGERPRGLLARKREAAKALIAIINSAADNIYGGLYDETRQSVIHIDCLLALLGEASVFVNHSPPLLTQAQALSLLTAIESLQNVSSSVYDQCADCLASTLTAYHSPSSPPSASSSALLNPQDMLRKTLSSSSSGFSMVGSEMLASAASSGSIVKIGERRGSGKKQDETKRGWDWRAGIKKNADAKHLLRRLRLDLAKDISRSWVMGENNLS